MPDKFDDRADAALAEWVDQVADCFDAAWQNGPPPRIADFLGEAAGARRSALLAELVKIDLEYRWRAGAKVKIEDYLPQFLELLGPDGMIADDLVLHASKVTSQFAGDETETPPKDVGPASKAELPRTLGKFQLLQLLGEGSFGSVYKARDAALNRTVAIKVPRAGCFGSAEAKERFLREAKSAAQLTHANIVPVHEIASDGSLPYIVSDYVDGQTLADFLLAQRPGFRQAAELLASIADALDYAHRRHVIHRDVNPRNILIDRAGVPHVTDFGLARHDDGTTVVTVEGQILGTPAYLAPEQAAGEVGKVDARNDVYSLGVILYEMLTGERPFRGSATMVLRQVLHEEPKPPRQLDSRIPRDLETICLKAMAKEPPRRYQTAGDLADDLRRFVDGKPIVARPAGGVEKLWRWCRRNPVVAGLTAAVAGLLLAVTVGSIIASISFAHVAKGEQQAKIEASRRRQQAEEAAARARAERGLLLLEGGNVEGLLDLLAARQSMESNPDAQEPWSILWFGWYAACKDRLERVVGHDSEVIRVAFSPDGELLATASSETVQLWETATGRPHGRALQLQGFRDMAFSPDGKTLAVATAESVLRLWDTSTCHPLDKDVQAEGAINVVRFSPDGKLLAIVTEKETALWDTDTWQRRVGPLQRHNEGAPLLDAIAFTPDGSVLAVGMNSGTVHVWATATGKPHCQPLCHGRPGRSDHREIMSVAFSPDGKRLVTGSKHNTARLWDVDTGQPLGKVMEHKEHIWAVAFSPKGDRVGTASYDGTAQLWDAETGIPRGGPLRHDGPLAALAFNADGSLLATCSSDTTARLWDTATGQATGMPLRHQGAVRRVAFNRDGSLLATAGSTDKTARLWRIEPERPQVWSAPHSHRVYSVAFSPDGKDIITGSEDGLVQLLDTPTGKCRLKPVQASSEMPVVSVDISPDGKLLAAQGIPIRIWERESRRPRNDQVPFKDSWVVKFSPNGRLLANGPASGGPIGLWDLETKKPLPELVAHKGRVFAMAFSADGQLLLSGCADKTAVLWDLSSGHKRVLPHPEGVEAVAISPDGKLLATACRDLTVRFWEAETGQAAVQPQPFRYHTRIEALAFSPDGKMLATASWDGTARLWALPVGLPCGPPYRHDLVASSVAFSPDGKFLATGSFDRTVRLWRVPVLISDLHEIEVRSWVALGARLNQQGIVEPIPWDQWQKLREELRGLEPRPEK